MEEGTVRYERSGVVGRITFDSPATRNALTRAMWSRLGDLCEEIARDPEVRVVTLRGAGGDAFVSGSDIRGFLGFDTGERGVEYEREIDRCIGAVEALPQPTVAVIEGWAVGGGLILSFVCDFRIATTEARFGSPLGRTIGNCLSAHSYAALVAHLGIPQVKRMLLLGEIVPARELADLGVLTRVVEPDEVDATVDDLCAKLATMAPLTIRATKEAIRRLSYANLPDIEDLIELVYGSEDFRTGVRGFLEKRPREWKGR